MSEGGVEMSSGSYPFLKAVMAKVRGEPPAHPVYVFGMHKGGSSMLSSFFQGYTRAAGIKGISISNHMFEKGISDEAYTHDLELCPLMKERFVFFGFRYVPAFMLINKSRFLNVRGIVLVRDPRDCAVSAFYSFLRSHVVLAGDETGVALQISEERERHTTSSIDDYVLSEIGRFVEEIHGYSFFAHENLRIFRYEDIIFEKRAFFLDAIRYLRIKWNEPAFEKALTAVDIFPDTEQPDRHVRNVTPGNFREKLAKSTIDAINSKYERVLGLYGYAA